MSAGSRISNNAACGAGGGKKSTKRLKFSFQKCDSKEVSAEEDYSRHIEGKKSKLGTSVGVVPLVSLLRLLLWVVGLAEGEMEAGCRFTPSCHHICVRRGTQAALNTHPGT